MPFARLEFSTFAHVHTLSMRFHLERKTGGLSRVIDRGTKGIDTLLGFVIFSIFPTILELALDAAILWIAFGIWYAIVTTVMVIAYIWFTFAITRWRIQFRREMNQSDTDASTKAVDSLLNFETVKYFNNEAHETARFDKAMAKYANASISDPDFALRAQHRPGSNRGDRVDGCADHGRFRHPAPPHDGRRHCHGARLSRATLRAAELARHGLPRNHPGAGRHGRDVPPAASAAGSNGQARRQSAESHGRRDRFDNVVFSYDPERIVLKGVSFVVPAGKTIAVVGPSGAGKSTISRILYRFYDIRSGSVTIDGQDIRDVTQESLRAVIGIVPQDTVLFNDTVRYNIAYGRIGASEVEIKEAAGHAQIDKFIRDLPLGYESMVGERGLKLSGGEKQRVAIARTILKNPPILLLDEATSALDTHTEREIQSALQEVSKNRTTLVIAHRLSTVIDADEILVLDHGEIVERGRHDDLLQRRGAYASMWNKQREAAAAREKLKEVESDPDVTPGIARVLPLAAD